MNNVIHLKFLTEEDINLSKDAWYRLGTARGTLQFIYDNKHLDEQGKTIVLNWLNKDDRFDNINRKEDEDEK